MTLIDIFFLAVALAMDCFAVSITCGIIAKRLVLKIVLLTAFMFGLFQAVMPLLGWLGINSFSSSFQAFDHWIAFGLLGFLGVKMILDGIKPDEEENKHLNPSKFSTILTMSIATSIDALAIGVSMAFLGVNIWSAVLLIGITTGLFSFVGVYIGKFFGCRYKSKAEFVGGFILFAMGLKILLEHTIG